MTLPFLFNHCRTSPPVTGSSDSATSSIEQADISVLTTFTRPVFTALQILFLFSAAIALTDVNDGGICSVLMIRRCHT